MGYLTAFLQAEFARQLPQGWSCRSEVQVLPKELVNVLGYSSRVDVLLEREQDSKKLWIEFEVSRADPVANHAKFATSHLFKPQHPNDAFIGSSGSMVISFSNQKSRLVTAYGNFQSLQTHKLDA
jgi:hypothetical protein